jgi:hypothetical protein
MISAFGQGRQSEVPGDHFSLEGALELFKKSASPEEFEQLLNSADSKVNNLDLNGDGEIDYIKVVDRNEGNVHAFILQAIVSETESQDVAVIELEKLANGKAVLQIMGDSDVYGIETIIEPTEEVRINAGTSTARNVINVWTWPSVQFIYSPYYSSSWISPWGWSRRPLWWRPWRPVDYYVYDPWWQPYRPYYSVCYTHRINYAQQIYHPYRTSSNIVYSRHSEQIAHYRSTRGVDDGNGRGRYNDSQMNGGQANGTNRPDTNGRHRSVSGHGRNSRSSADDASQEDDRNINRRFSVARDKANHTQEFQREPGISDRNWTGRQRSSTSDHNTRSHQQTTRPAYQQQTTRPAYQPRNSQRSSSSQYERKGSSGSVQRPANGGGNTSHKRGRQ